MKYELNLLKAHIHQSYLESKSANVVCCFVLVLTTQGTLVAKQDQTNNIHYVRPSEDSDQPGQMTDFDFRLFF